jgi:hypothetical protein
MTGHMRTYKKTLESYKKLTNKYDVDVYISTWNYLNTNNDIIINKQEIINDYLNINCKNVYIEIEEFTNKPITYVYYKLYKTNNLRLSINKKYDIFLRSRPDIWLFNDYDYEIKDNTLFLQYCNLYDETYMHNDRFFYSNENVMNIICNLYNDFDLINQLNPDILKHSHGILNYYCKLKNININIFDKENINEIIR